MSLIEEALRMQEQEEARQNLPPGPSSPVVPSRAVVVAMPVFPETDLIPVADSPQLFHAPAVSLPRPIRPDIDRQRNLTLTILAGIGVMVLLLLAGGVFLLMGHAKKSADSTTVVPAVIPPAAQVPVPIAPAVLPPTQTPAAPEPVAWNANLVSNATAAATAAASSGRETIVAPAPAVVPPPSPTPVVTVTWPEIVVKGMFSSNGKTLVLLGDGFTLEIGTMTPAGVRLLEAGPGWTRMAYKGQIRTYRRNGGVFLVDTDAVGADSVRP